MTDKLLLGKLQPQGFRCTNPIGLPLNGAGQNDFLGIDFQEIQVTANPELVSRPYPLIGVRMARVLIRVRWRRGFEPNPNTVCCAGGFRDKRDGVDVAAQLVRREVQSNDQVLEEGFADTSGFVLQSEGVYSFLKVFPPTSDNRVRQ